MKQFALLMLVVIGLSAANDSSYNRGEMIFFSKGCSSCHGADAEGSGMYPKLAGKEEDYIIKKLKNFRAGKTTSTSQDMMAQFAQKLSDKNIQDLAHFFFKHKKGKEEKVNDDILGGFGS